MITNPYVKNTLETFISKNEGKKEYIQAATEILESLDVLFNEREDLVKQNILERFL